MEARQHLAKAVGANSDHQGKANSRVVGVAAADPVPELEHVGGIDAELLHLLGICGDGDEMPGNRLLAAQGLDTPGTSRTGVGERLLRGEGFGANDEERLCRVEITDGFHELVAVNVGDEAY